LKYPRVLYMGGQTVGEIGLETLLAIGWEPDVIQYKNMKISRCRKIFKSIKDARPGAYDILICVHGREIVPKEFLESLKWGGLNVHPCLWKYKGANPIGRLIQNKDSVASVGCHRMTEKLDEGEVLYETKVRLPIAGDLLTSPDVYSILYPLYPIALIGALHRCELFA